MNRRHILFTAILVLTPLACRSTTTGNEGNLSFAYTADDDLFDFNKPIAVGAMLDLYVTESGTMSRPLTVTSASADDDGVLGTSGFEGNVITVVGVADGNVLISVETMASDGTVIADGVNMNVRVPEVHRMSHTCDLLGGGAYLTGSQVYVPYELEMLNGRSAIGYGYYPVSSSDETLFVRDETWLGQQFMRFEAVAAGNVTLSSDITDTTLEVIVADEESIDGAVEPIAWVLEDIDVGDVNPFYVLPTVAGTTVCQANATLEVAGDTPTICDVRVRDSALATGDAEHENGWFEIEGVAEGTCMYTVTYPNGSAGAGTTAQFTYPIQP